MVELWVGITPSGWNPAIWIPLKRSPEDCRAKGRGLDQGISSPVNSNLFIVVLVFVLYSDEHVFHVSYVKGIL